MPGASVATLGERRMRAQDPGSASGDPVLPVGLLFAPFGGSLTMGGRADVEQVVGAFAAEIPE